MKAGKLQLPDFQRGWIWDDEHIRSLLVSVSLGYPVGALMFWDTGAAPAFKTRPIEGADPGGGVEPDTLILDGQQRLTSLYQALMLAEPVRTKDPKGKLIERWYYLDISVTLDPDGDPEDRIVAMPPDRIRRSFAGEIERDCSTREKEYESLLLPVACLVDSAGYNDWIGPFMFGDGASRERAVWDQLTSVVGVFTTYQLPVITLKRETPKEAVCQVFEKVNTGGVALTVFELLTATFAIDNFNLRDDWDARKKRIDEIPQLQSIENTDFIQVVTLLATVERQRVWLASESASGKPPPISCKRRDMLRLTVEEYRRWSDSVEAALKDTAKLLASLKIFAASDVPYRTQLVPLSAILVLLGPNAHNDVVRSNLVRWLWCGIFGELYGSATETRFARDVPEVVGWVEGGSEPGSVVDSHFAENRLHSLKTRRSAAYKGLHALLMASGAKDFLAGKPIDIESFFNDSIDIHHVFPRHWCNQNGISKNERDSIVNKTPLTARTNRMIGGRAPSAYITTIEGKGLSPTLWTGFSRAMRSTPN